MSVLRWEAPPPPPRNTSHGKPRGAAVRKWGLVAQELEMRPGQWALVAEDVALSTYGTLRKYGLEVVTRGQHGSRVDRIYARWPASGEGDHQLNEGAGQ